MQIFLRLLVFFHGNIDLSLQAFELIFIVNDLPILALLNKRLEFIDLLLEPFLMIINILMHFPLSINKHMTCKLLNTRHHYLRFDPEIVLL